jgi:hypothetical protein
MLVSVSCLFYGLVNVKLTGFSENGPKFTISKWAFPLSITIYRIKGMQLLYMHFRGKSHCFRIYHC